MTDQKHTQMKLVHGGMQCDGVSIRDDISFNPRLVDCWNALAGVDDPAAFMAAAQKAVDTYSMLECSDAVTAMGKHLKGSDK